MNSITVNVTENNTVVEANVIDQPVNVDVSVYQGTFMGLKYGSKYSALDAGTLLDMSVDDDFLYICVESGTVGNARWKRIPLKQI